MLHYFLLYEGAPVSSCGFFQHPNDSNYGASPDGFTEAFVVEVKTRPENAETPLEKSLAHMSFREISKSVVQRDRSYSYSDTYQKEKSLLVFSSKEMIC